MTSHERTTPPLEPINQRLDEFFVHILGNDPEQRGADAAPGIAVLWGVDSAMSVECVQIINLDTRERVEIVRPTLDSAIPFGSIRDTETGAAPDFNICVEDLFMRSSEIEVPGETCTHVVPEVNYSVFGDSRICIWAVAVEGDESVVVMSEASAGTAEYDNLQQLIITATGLDAVLAFAALSPEDFS